ncbi:MAG: helix-turn-helix transcriptional regulator [Bacteroidales bacterium]|nr:helix-turn-helix transcriptional regulator [Bacteroidales bacterium]
MINAFILLLPAAVSFFWLLLYPLTIPKAGTYKPLMFLALAIGLFFLADSCYSSPLTSARTLAITSMFTQLAGPSIIPLLLIYLRKIGNNDQLKHIHLIWVLIPFILFTGELTMVVIYGIDNIEKYLSDFYTYGIDVANLNSGYVYNKYYLWAVVLFRVVMAVEILLILVNFALLIWHRGLPLRYLTAFLYRKGNIKVLGLSYAALSLIFIICIFKMAFLRDVLLQKQWIPLTTSVLLALLLFAFFYFGLFSTRKTVHLSEMKQGIFYVDMDPDSASAAGEGRSDSSVKPAATGNRENDMLLNKFQRIVVNQEMFLQPRLTITEVADRLGSNKTYISKLVNSTYHMPFPDLINSLRVDFAQRYIINHREATQADVARASGFTSASALNNIFKKVTGMTPKIWLATYDRKHNS